MRLTPAETAHVQTRLHAATDDQSALVRFLQPWWNASMAAVPSWVAPNVLTVLGSLCVLVPTALALWWSPTLTDPLPRWLIALQILGVFGFQTLDALDGKQARRTGSSSPLGSWLDHSLDIATIQLMLLGVVASMQAGFGALAWAWLAICVTNNYLLHWESSHTGTLILSNGSSITDVQVSAMALHAVALVSSTIYPTTIGALLPATAGGIGSDLTVAAVVMIFSVVVIGSIAAAGSIVRVLRSDVPRRESLRRLVSIFVIVVPGTAAIVAVDDIAVQVVVGAGTLLLGVRSVGRIVLENLLRRVPVTVDVGIVFAALLPLVVLLPDIALETAAGLFMLAAFAFMWFFVDTARSLAVVLGESVFVLSKPKSTT